MFDLIVLAGLAFAAFIVIGVLISVFTVAGWFLWLPFKIALQVELLERHRVAPRCDFAGAMAPPV